MSAENDKNSNYSDPPFAKSHLRCFPFAHVVTSPYECMKTALCKQAYTVFISYIRMALNSYQIYSKIQDQTWSVRVFMIRNRIERKNNEMNLNGGEQNVPRIGIL